MTKTIKKSIAVILAILSVFSCFSFCVSAVDADVYNHIGEYMKYVSRFKLDRSMYLFTTSGLAKLDKNAGNIKIYFSEEELPSAPGSESEAEAMGATYVKDLAAKNVSLYKIKSGKGSGNILIVDYRSANLKQKGYYYAVIPAGFVVDSNGVASPEFIVSSRFYKYGYDFLDSYVVFVSQIQYIIIKTSFLNKLS